MAFVRIEAGPDNDAVPVTANAARAHALARENNVLPWRSDALSDAALEALDALLDQISLHRKRYTSKSRSNVQAGAFLLQVALVTGRPIMKLMALPVIIMEPSRLNEDSPSGLYIGRRQWAWWFAAGRPTSMQELPANAAHLYRTVQRNMLLWCGERTRRLFRSAMKSMALRLVRTKEENGVRTYLTRPNDKNWSTAVTRNFTSACLTRIIHRAPETGLANVA